MRDELSRIDEVSIPLPGPTGAIFLFAVRPYPYWDPWWGAFMSFLTAMAEGVAWKAQKLTGTEFATLELNEGQIEALRKMLLTAPTEEVAAHRTLRRAIDWRDRPGCFRTITFFREKTS